MLELIAIALFQLASLSDAAATTSLSQPTPTSATETGIGGWGHDRAAVGTTAPTGDVNPTSETGIGGWGHD